MDIVHRSNVYFKQRFGNGLYLRSQLESLPSLPQSVELNSLWLFTLEGTQDIIGIRRVSTRKVRT
jgi:hypothetical protein